MATGKEIRAKLKEEARERARLESMEERQAKVAAPGSEGYKPTKTDMGPNMSQVNKPDSKKATTKATTKTPIVTKKQLEDSGFTNLRDYLNNKKGLTRRDGAAPERTNNKPESTTKSQDAKPNKSNTPKPDYSNKTKAKTSMVDKFKSLVGADREPTAKEAMGRNQMNAARKSMGFRHGGNVKGKDRSLILPKRPRDEKGKGLNLADRDVYKKMAERDNPAAKRMLEEKPKRPPKGTIYSIDTLNKKVKKYKKGGSIDGCAVRGHTRAKHR
jgi:hypothetical protein